MHKSKSHLDLRIELKGRLLKDNLYPSGYHIVQVPGDNAFLNDSVGLYTKNPALKEILYLCLLRGVVAKMSGNSTPKLLMLVYNFYLILNSTSHNSFDFVSGNIYGPALRTINNRQILSDSRSKPFVDYS